MIEGTKRDKTSVTKGSDFAYQIMTCSEARFWGWGKKKISKEEDKEWWRWTSRKRIGKEEEDKSRGWRK